MVPKATSLDLLALARAVGPMPLRFSSRTHDWETLHPVTGKWIRDRGLGRRLSYLRGLDMHIPASTQELSWHRVQRQIQTQQGCYSILRDWVTELWYEDPRPRL